MKLNPFDLDLKNLKHLKSILIILIFLSSPLLVFANGVSVEHLVKMGLSPKMAEDILKNHGSSLLDEKNGLFFKERIIQNLVFEQKFNCQYMEKSCAPLTLKAVPFMKDQAVADIDASTPSFIRDDLEDNNRFFIPVHPFNTSLKAGAQAELQSGLFKEEDLKKITAYQTASRSLYVVKEDGHAYALKVGTDHLYDKKDPRFNAILHFQPGKVDVGSEAPVARNHSDFILSIDERRSYSPIFLKEIAAITVKTEAKETKVNSATMNIQRNGLIIRDITPLTQDYYLPALSIPYAGDIIAQKNGKDFNTFWKEHYAKALGKAKAQLLLRYGMQMFTPNAQNMLIKLHPESLMPQEIIFRDLPDAFFIEPVAKFVSDQKAIEKDRKFDSKTIQQTLYPYWSNSSWRLDEAPKQEGRTIITQNMLKDWGKAHLQGYLEEIQKELNIEPIKQLNPANPNDRIKIENYYKKVQQDKVGFGYGVFKDDEEASAMAALMEFLESPAGQEALKKYQKRLNEVEFKQAVSVLGNLDSLTSKTSSPNCAQVQ